MERPINSSNESVSEAWEAKEQKSEKRLNWELQAADPHQALIRNEWKMKSCWQ